jgi:hypothetical protein
MKPWIPRARTPSRTSSSSTVLGWHWLASVGRFPGVIPSGILRFPRPHQTEPSGQTALDDPASFRGASRAVSVRPLTRRRGLARAKKEPNRCKDRSKSTKRRCRGAADETGYCATHRKAREKNGRLGGRPPIHAVYSHRMSAEEVARMPELADTILLGHLTVRSLSPRSSWTERSRSGNDGR